MLHLLRRMLLHSVIRVGTHLLLLANLVPGMMTVVARKVLAGTIAVQARHLVVGIAVLVLILVGLVQTAVQAVTGNQ